ncbi:MAG TPA: FAD-dependent oxidoreductase [Deltaproteobacteria bacterium]|nr:FAD-dependent oxidoreductase [Deltaproteobacteria bacterium]
MQFDLIVIGGGVNGCGIARDAAMRGLKTVLIEKNDFGSGTTGASSQMIHGGARYLISDVETTRLSSLDSGYIQKIAPHLLFRIPFLFPVMAKPGRSGRAQKIYLEFLETYFEAYDKFSPLKNGKPHTRLNKEEALALEPDLSENLIGAVTFDEWGIDSFRLCLGNVASAAEHGAEIHNHTEVTEILKEGGRVVGVKVRHLLDGARSELRAKIVFNAAGPWVPKIAELAGCEVKLRPAKGVHLVIDRRIVNYAIAANAIDGRSIFIMPYQNTTIIGTTDDDYFGDPDAIPILEDEIEYLLDGIEQVFPRVRQARIIHAWAGVRPTLFKRGPYEDDLSREHEIFDHETAEHTPGFLSIAGGKLASYRLMSEEAVDAVCRKLGVSSPCRTHQVPLPGGERILNPEDLAKEYGVPLFAANRLVYRHGARAMRILEMVRERAAQGNVICQCEPVLECELRYAVRHEWARSPGDLRRRTRYSIGPCQGTRCSMMGAQILGEELNWSPEEVFRQLRSFEEKSWHGRAPILDNVSVQEEELAAFTFCNVGNVDQWN